MNKLWLLLFFAVLYATDIFCQQEPDSTKGIKVPAQIENGDTVVIVDFDAVTIPIAPSQPVFESKREQKRYSKLVYNLKKVYPYAKLAKVKYVEMLDHLKTLNSEKERNTYTKKLEKEILGQYEDQIKDLTRTQGILLNKLIYRELSRTSYDLLKEFRGRIPTFFYQTLARLFGINLKIKYDPNGEDKPIEDILNAIDAGLI